MTANTIVTEIVSAAHGEERWASARMAQSVYAESGAAEIFVGAASAADCHVLADADGSMSFLFFLGVVHGDDTYLKQTRS